MLKGIDISEWQAPSSINYDAMASNVDFVILRGGYTGHNNGKDPRNFNKDRHFETHYNEFKKRNVPIGVYYYGGAVNKQEADKEIEMLMSVIKGKTFEYPIYYDVEENLTHGKLSKSQLTSVVTYWCETMENKGYYVGIYASLYWFNNKLGDVSRFTRWLAQWDVSSPSISCDMWQYTETGRLPRYVGNLDLNYSYVDFEEVIVKGGFNGFDKVGLEPESKPEKVKWKPGQRIAFSTIYIDAWGNNPSVPYFKEHVDGVGEVGVGYVVAVYEKKGATSILGISNVKDGEILGWTKPVNVYKIL